MKRREYSPDTSSAITPILVMVAMILALVDLTAVAEGWIVPSQQPMLAAAPHAAPTPANLCAPALPEELRDMIGRD